MEQKHSGLQLEMNKDLGAISQSGDDVSFLGLCDQLLPVPETAPKCVGINRMVQQALEGPERKYRIPRGNPVFNRVIRR